MKDVEITLKGYLHLNYMDNKYVVHEEQGNTSNDYIDINMVLSLFDNEKIEIFIRVKP